MGALSARFPEDDEAATLYALALMRTARRGQQSVQVDMQAGAIALRVFRKNGNHPGAVHYIIHAFDEPSRAIVGLEAADIYAGLAPDAPHALHMPSHIYVQLGRWDKLSVANTASYEASARRSERKHLHAIEGHAFHAMFWLHYAYLMQGNFAKADEALALAERHSKDTPAGPRSGQFDVMQARHTIETARWRKVDVTSLVAKIQAAAKDVNVRAASSMLLAAALSAARLGDAAASELAAGGLRDLAALSKARGVTETKQLEIMALEATGMALLARGDRNKAVEALEEAAKIEESMDPPSGPPGEQETDPPIKPAHELLGEVLVEIGRPADAARQFSIGLGRTPNRPRLLLGSAQSAVKTNDSVTARLRYQQLVDLPGGGPDRPGLAEARAHLAQASSRAVPSSKRYGRSVGGARIDDLALQAARDQHVVRRRHDHRLDAGQSFDERHSVRGPENEDAGRQRIGEHRALGDDRHAAAAARRLAAIGIDDVVIARAVLDEEALVVA